VKFWTSANGITYTQVGSTVTTAGTTSVFAGAGLNAVNWELGGQGGSPFVGKIYSVEIRDGIGGAILNPQVIDAWRPAATTITFAGAPELWFINGSYGGATLASITVNLAAMCPNYWQSAAIVSLSLNEGSFGPTKMAAYGTFLTALKAQLPLAQVVLLTQNPTLSAHANSVAQAQRRLQMLSWGPLNGHPLIDTYGVFSRDSRGLAALIEGGADGVHPNATGSALWAAAIEAVLAGSL
jgi:hypothetical protein